MQNCHLSEDRVAVSMGPEMTGNPCPRSGREGRDHSKLLGPYSQALTSPEMSELLCGSRICSPGCPGTHHIDEALLKLVCLPHF